MCQHPKKVELSYKLDNASYIAQFISWYEEAKRTTNPDSGRKRKGNARKALQDYLESLISEGGISTTTLDQKPFMEAVIQYKEDNNFHLNFRKQKIIFHQKNSPNSNLYYEKMKRKQKRIGLLTDEFNFIRL